MASVDRNNRASDPSRRVSGEERIGFGSSLLRHAGRQSRFLAGSLISGFVFGLAYRALFNPAAERTLAYFLAAAFTAWASP
jgi:hypothetical protein